jgi:hypothetical protein
MKQYLLFAGRQDGNSKGVHGLVGAFDSFAEAFVSLVDQQAASEWWHVLDTRTGEVVERRHLKISNGMIGFQRSDWLVGPRGQQDTVGAPQLPISVPMPKAAELSGIEAGLRTAVANGIKSGRPAVQPAGAAADH